MKYEDHIISFFQEYPHLYSPENLNTVKKVNEVIDQFAHFPNMETLGGHRKFLHHYQGIEYFTATYGNVGAMAATKHILDDMGHIPQANDYYTGRVNSWGGKLTKTINVLVANLVKYQGQEAFYELEE